MTARTVTLCFLALAALVGAGLAFDPADPGRTAAVGVPAVLPADGQTAGATLVSVTPFVLEQPMVHAWCAEQTVYDAGLLVVLSVEERALLERRQVAEPVLYVGALPAERINDGHLSGRVLAIVPSARDGGGRPALLGQPLQAFLGQPALPEAVDAVEAARQVDRATAAGLKPQDFGRGDEAVLTFPDHGELLAFAATLLAAHAPDEVDLARGLLAPRVGR